MAGVETGEETGEEREEELILAHDLSGVGSPEPADFAADFEAVPRDKLSGVPDENPLDCSEIENCIFEMAPEEAQPETDPDPERILSGSVNFDTSLEAALFYARDGWQVIPICNFAPERGRCTADRHKPDSKGKPCAGKRPLVKGDGEPGDGYTAATRDLDQIRGWWGDDFPDAGVGIRLDDHILIDCDVKDGATGLESYEILSNTFALPETLTAITHSSGRHYVFKLPDDLPADWLKSWTRPLDKIALGGIDLKVGACGLLYAEPTRGSKGVYRWIDPTFPPSVLPRAACDFLHEIRYKDDRPQAEKARQSRVYSSAEPQQFRTDQAQFFRDVPRGDRHKRLLSVGTAIRRQTRAGAAEIIDALTYHARRFSDPLDDPAWIRRVARELELKF